MSGLSHKPLFLPGVLFGRELMIYDDGYVSRDMCCIVVYVAVQAAVCMQLQRGMPPPALGVYVCTITRGCTGGRADPGAVGSFLGRGGWRGSGEDRDPARAAAGAGMARFVVAVLCATVKSLK